MRLPKAVRALTPRKWRRKLLLAVRCVKGKNRRAFPPTIASGPRSDEGRSLYPEIEHASLEMGEQSRRPVAQGVGRGSRAEARRQVGCRVCCVGAHRRRKGRPPGRGGRADAKARLARVRKRRIPSKRSERSVTAFLAVPAPPSQPQSKRPNNPDRLSAPPAPPRFRQC